MSEYISKAKYTPVFLPLCYVKSLIPGTNTVVDVLSKEFPKNCWIELSKVWATRNSNVTLWVYQDGINRVDANTNALLDLDKANEMKVVNMNRFKVDLRSTTTVSPYIIRLGVWIDTPTIADKLQMGVKLTDEEREIAEELGLLDSFAKGLVPVPREYFVQRHYQVINELTRAIQADLTATGGLYYNYTSTSPDRFFVVKSIACMDTSATTYNAAVTIIRDEEEALSIPLPALSIDYDIPLFIPAMDTVEIVFTTDTDVSDFRARWTIAECRLTDYLKMKWGLISKEENEDLWKEVIAGL
ncbi:MAG: hypothetical protein ACXQTR_00010 [Candidatus Methanospirareceae archaeon]